MCTRDGYLDVGSEEVGTWLGLLKMKPATLDAFWTQPLYVHFLEICRQVHFRLWRHAADLQPEGM